jgi:hypothetical protein
LGGEAPASRSLTLSCPARTSPISLGLRPVRILEQNSGLVTRSNVQVLLFGIDLLIPTAGIVVLCSAVGDGCSFSVEGEVGVVPNVVDQGGHEQTHLYNLRKKFLN